MDKIIKLVRMQGVEKIITIPAKSEIEAGDYVFIQKLNLNQYSLVNLSRNSILSSLWLFNFLF